MTAQAYFDDQDDLIVRIFDRQNNRIADLPVADATKEAADEALALMKLRRRIPWKQLYKKDLEATVRFVR